MATDILTIVLCGILVLLAVITPLCNGFFRKPSCKKELDGGISIAPVKFSIIITSHDKGNELERNLPEFLSQDYEPGFEVIVVDESSTDNTDDVLTLLKNKYPNLYSTFIPESSHYLSRRKLALTIGIKAAKNEWLILTDADCRPDNKEWLKAISRHCSEQHDLVLGYTSYQPSSKMFHRFERLLTSCYLLRKAQNGTAYRYNGNNLAMRKSIFMCHNGFLKNLKYLRGEYDFIVNEYALPGRAAIAIEKEAFIRQEEPSLKTWINEHLYYAETRKHLKRSFLFRTLFNFDTFMLHFNYILELAILVGSIITGNILLISVSAISLILTLVLRIVIAKKAANAFGERISRVLVPFMELRIMWHNAWFLLRHHFSDKYDFIRR